MKEILGKAAIRTVAGIAVLAGVTGVVHAEVDSLKSPANIEKRVVQLVPGYNPDYNRAQFERAQQVIVDFGKKTPDLVKKGAKTIEVPENVTQAATFIREEREQETYQNEGRKLYLKMSKNNFHKNFGVILGSFVVGISGTAVLAVNLSSKRRERITQGRQSNSAQTQS